MGFYQPAQIVADAAKHGVEVRPVDINHSCWDNSLEELAGNYCALRLGFRQVKGLKADDMGILIACRGDGYPTIAALRSTAISQAALERLADADAFRSIGLDRRQALWEVAGKDRPVALFKGEKNNEQSVDLPVMAIGEHVVQDYATMALSLKAHPVSFVREKLDQLHVCPAARLSTLKDGMQIRVAGLVLVRQRPGTAGGVCFMTVEDETGTANLVIFENLFERFRKEILQSRLIMAEGRLQIEGEVIHVVVHRAYDFSRLLRTLTSGPRANPAALTLSYPDEGTHSPLQVKKARTRERTDEKIFPDARNFK